MKRFAFTLLVFLLLAFGWFAATRIHFIHRPQVLYIGDSLCESVHDGKGMVLTQIASIARDCIGGRKSIEYGDIPKGKQLVFYALGTNDVGHTPPAVYQKDLRKKLSESDASWIICVLPDGRKKKTEPYRDAMRHVCPVTIEPRDHGYYFSAKDGVHGSADDHRRFGEWLNGYVDRLLREKPWLKG